MTKSAKFATFALYVSLALILWFAVAAFGPKFGFLDWKIGLGVMTFGWGIFLIGGAALIAVIALIWTLIRAPRTGWLKALVALIIPGIFFAALGQVKATSESVPPIYDITTDTANAPMYSVDTLANRASLDANPLLDFATPLGTMEQWKTGNFASVGDKTPAELIAEGYPDLKTIVIPGTTEEATDLVADVMLASGFTDIRSEDGMVEGVAETFLFGFKDDVVARITPVETGSAVDFRSTSRVGLSDLGENAKRIKGLMDDVDAASESKTAE